MLNTKKDLKYNSYELVKRIVKTYVFKHSKRISIAIVLMLIVAAISAFHVWLVRPALDGIFISKNSELREKAI